MSNQTAIRSLLWKLQRSHFELLSVNDGEETTSLSGGVHKRRTEAVDIITSVEVAWLRVGYGAKKCTLMIVPDLEGGEILADYTVYEPLEKVVDQFYDQWS